MDELHFNEGHAAEAPPERTLVKPKTLNELLRALCMIDEAMLDVNLDDAPDLMEAGKVKVDSYKYLIDRFDSMAEELKKKENEYKAARRTIENQRERLMGHMMYALETNGFDQFTGHQYKVRVQHSEYVDLKFTEPGAHHKIHFTDLVKTTYEWKKSDIKRILKTDIEKIQDEADRELAEKVREIASIAKRPGIRFSVLKDL